MDDIQPSLPTSGMGGPMPNVVGAPPPQVQMAPQAPAQPQAPPPNRHEILGRTFNALLGNSSSYSVDPNGNTVETNTPQPPGHLFKSILAAALLGGAAGANGNPNQGFAGGVVRGGAAEIGEGQKQDLLKRQQAQQQFQNQQKAAQEQREAGAAVTEDQLRKAQIAHANIETANTNQIMQGRDFAFHSEVADRGKQHFSDYKAAGLEPVAKDVSESDMTAMFKNRPGASSLDWEATGTKISYGADGTPHYQSTYTAYDPKAQVPISKGTIDQFKADGFDKYYPELFDILKPGKSLDYNQYIELKRKDAQLFNDNQTRQKAAQGTQEFDAKLKLTNAETASHLATAQHERAETSKIGSEQKASQSLSAAYKDVDDNKGDMTKVKPSTRVIVGESYSKMMPGISAEIRSAQAEGDEDKVKSLMTELDGMRHLATQAMQGPQAQPAAQGTIMLNKAGQQVLVPADKMDAATKAGYKPYAKPTAAPAGPPSTDPDDYGLPKG